MNSGTLVDATPAIAPTPDASLGPDSSPDAMEVRIHSVNVNYICLYKANYILGTKLNRLTSIYGDLQPLHSSRIDLLSKPGV